MSNRLIFEISFETKCEMKSLEIRKKFFDNLEKLHEIFRNNYKN